MNDEKSSVVDGYWNRHACAVDDCLQFRPDNKRPRDSDVQLASPLPIDAHFFRREF